MFRKNLTFIFIILSIAIFTLDYFGLLDSFKAPMDKVIIPVKKSLFSFKKFSGNFFSVIVNFDKFDQINSDFSLISKEKEELKLQMDLLTQENQKLRTQLEAPLPATFKYVPAQVVSFSRYLEINAGKKDGVKEGMPVIDGSTLIGKVVMVYPGRSKILLPWDLESAVPVKTQRDVKGVAVGQSGETITLDKILQKDPLFIDDWVFTSGENGFPPNMLIGKVIHIISDETNVYKKAKIEPVVKYQQEKIVFVLTDAD